MKTENLTKEQAEIILKIRDALALENIDEAYHCLYQIASPDFDKINPWSELERIAASGSVAAPKEEPKEESELLEQVIKSVVGIKPGAVPLTPMDYGECKECMKQYAVSLRDQLREKDELIKELTAAVELAKGHLNIYDQKTRAEFDSLIKKSQKL